MPRRFGCDGIVIQRLAEEGPVLEKLHADEIHVVDWVPRDGISVKLNDAAVDGLEPADPDRNPKEGQWLQGNLDAKQINRGENQDVPAQRTRCELPE